MALLVSAAATVAGIPFDWFGVTSHCHPDTSCEIARRGELGYWALALPLAYAVIVACYARVRGLGSRLLTHAITGVATTVVFTGTWLAEGLYLPSHPHSLSYWWLVLDRLFAPWSALGIVLLALARLERNTGLLLFAVCYLATVVLVLPMGEGWGPPHWGIRAQFAVPQLVSGYVLVLGAVGFAEGRWRP